MKTQTQERGNVSVEGTQMGTLMIVEPRDLTKLHKEAGTRFSVPADLDVPTATDVTVRQGAIEQSNVNPILTLVEMIDALRVYEAAQKAARGVDETVSRAVNDVGRPNGA